MKFFDTAIIGAGPAGIAAAIQLQRFGISTVIFEKDKIGGLLRNANLVENYLGFPSGITGKQLTRLMEKHLNSVNSIVHNETVEDVEYINSKFVIKTSRSYLSKTLIIATGTDAKPSSVSGFDPSTEPMIITEVHQIEDCENRRIAVIGAGDAAFDYALNLARKNWVTINNRSSRRLCLPLLWTRVGDKVNIEYRENCTIQSTKLKNDQLQLNWNRDGVEFNEIVDYLVLAIGRKPNLSFISKDLSLKISDLEEKGLLHFIGDVRNGIFRQASIAAGQGIHAAMALHLTLNRKG
ncbi:MAG: NAD(P)/FAD-dependent oxidoreductase [Calditrichaeota bacterium]|nr:NAD(P)/FAD-dependent oxidoreductase [Calditrichota bacterium]MBT7788036.1 NAD(P)/FAD-dependent oxidoreductase [Calditrichota bacterium]